MSIDNYYYTLVQHDSDTFTWNVIESQTNQTIRSFMFEEDAIKSVINLMSGYGFDGFTPRFFIE